MPCGACWPVRSLLPASARRTRSSGCSRPLPVELDLLCDDRRIAVTFARWWPALLARVDGERLPGVLDILMDCGGQNEVRVEIERRLRGVRKPRRDPLLLFYLAVVRYEEGSDHDARRFRDVLKRADAATRERLRADAARLARHTEEPLRHALQTFDFEPLDVGPGRLGPGPPPGLEAFMAALEEQLQTAGPPARPGRIDPVGAARPRRSGAGRTVPAGVDGGYGGCAAGRRATGDVVRSGDIRRSGSPGRPDRRQPTARRAARVAGARRESASRTGDAAGAGSAGARLPDGRPP